jgi:hypothetical protein
MHYLVLDRTTGRQAYKGDSLWACADSLVPGTCYGAGESDFAAFEMAMRQVEPEARQRMEREGNWREPVGV